MDFLNFRGAIAAIAVLYGIAFLQAVPPQLPAVAIRHVCDVKAEPMSCLTDIEFSHSGDMLSYTINGTTIAFFDMKLMRNAGVQFKAEQEFGHPAFSRDDKWVVACDGKDSICQLNLLTGKKSTLFKHGSTVRRVVFSDDGERLVIGGEDNGLYVRGVLNGAIASRFDVGQYVLDIAIVPNANQVLFWQQTVTDVKGKENTSFVQDSIRLADLKSGKIEVVGNLDFSAFGGNKISVSTGGDSLAYVNCPKVCMVARPMLKPEVHTPCPIESFNCLFAGKNNGFLVVSGSRILSENDGAGNHTKVLRGTVSVLDRRRNTWSDVVKVSNEAVEYIAYSRQKNLLAICSGQSNAVHVYEIKLSGD